ncbi:MAG: hypothetical protein KAV87_07485, partial [Desulfobacteraceae bacterium]|nr:hypothetical protein [Desulfobacteraceae bacterium]
MAKPRIIYNNLWRKGTALTPSSENPQHPSTDTQIDTLSMFYRASAKTSPCTIPMNLGAAPGAIDFVAILAQNIESSGVVITFEGADNATFDSGFVTRTITYNATNIFQFITTFTKQYVRLKLVKAGGDFTDYPQVATILCGSYFELSKTVGLSYEEGYEDFSELEYSDSQVIFAQEKEIIDIKTLPFRGLNNATRANILLFFNECGIHKAFVICFDATDANNESHWVVNSELIAPNYEQSDCWHWQLVIKEIV